MYRRIRSMLLRWRVFGPALVLSLPLILPIFLGGLWLWEHGYLLWYSLAVAVLAALMTLIVYLPRWFRSGDEAEEVDPSHIPHVEPDPDWSETEARAFAAGQKLIRAKLGQPLPFDDLQPFGIELLETVAAASGKSGKKPLDFTIPEALLLMERVSARLRNDLKRSLPVADYVSVGLIVWGWKHQAWARNIYTHGYTGWRVMRAVMNLPSAILREAGDLVSSGFGRMLRDESLIIMQVALFEEIARAAVELYSGRLRLSDAEILEFMMDDSELDRARLVSEDAPLRIAIAGQVSVGKSSLVNAILGEEAAETDTPPTTDRATTHAVEIAGLHCMLLDLPGLDGDEETEETTIEALTQSDIVLWLVAASRPAREIDRKVLAKWRAFYDGHQVLRRPPVIAVATFADRLVEGWPFPENILNRDAQERIQQAVTAIEAETGLPRPIPACLSGTEWNVTAVDRALASRLEDGIRVQRARTRHANANRHFGEEALRNARSLGQNLKWIGRQIGARHDGEEG